MANTIKASFRITSWDEQPYDEEEGLTLARARVTKTYQGDIQGVATLDYLMVYQPDGSANFVGVEHVRCDFAGRSGSFVLLHNGIFENGVSKIDMVVAQGSGTGDLVGLTATGRFESGRQEDYPLSLDFEFDEVEGSVEGDV